MKISDLLENHEQVYYHVTPKKNIPYILRDGLVPGIGRRSSKLGEIKENIYLFKTLDDVEEAIMNWMEDEFEDDLLAILKIIVPSTFTGIHQHPHAAWEYITDKTIPTQYISVLQDV